jgi:putative FmdB family regulatory protein
MPLYEYLCRDCGARFETLVRSWGDPVDCPVCDSAKVDKQVSRFALAASDGAPPAGGACCGRGGCGCRT